MTKTPNNVSDALPRAQIRRKRWSIAWIIPILAAAFAGYLFWQSWQLRGEKIIITFEEGHGIRVGHSLLYRGVKVGEVTRISLSDDLSGAEIEATLIPDAEKIARKGTHFWVVRPQISPTGVSGLETILGPNYIAVHPSESPVRRTRFIGLSAPPIIATHEPEDLEIVLQANTRGSLQTGVPVSYRGIRIGTVLSVALASDSSAVEARAHIDQNFAPLITEQTKFWDSGGVKMSLGFSGASVEVDSLSDLLIGGVSIAVPPNAGPPVRTGHRFHIAPEARSEWLAWQPTVPVGVELLPSGAVLPALERARLHYETNTFQMNKSRLGWVLPLEGGFIGPVDLITEPKEARNGTGEIEVVGRLVPAPRDGQWEENGIAFVGTKISDRIWPRSRMRAMAKPEDCLIVAGAVDTTMPLAAARMKLGEGTITIDEAVSFDDSWQGAAVLSRGDGALVGILLVDEGVGKVALLPSRLMAAP